MAIVVAHDLTRLLTAPLFLTPRGIDKVELALIGQLFRDASSPHLGIVPTPAGMRAIPARDVARLLAHVHEGWAETQGEAPSAIPTALENLALRMDGDRGKSPVVLRHRQPRLSMADRVVRISRLWRSLGIAPGKPVDEALPSGAVYLNSGQLGLTIPSLFRWLDRRTDVLCAMLLHDVIPLEYPELVRPGQATHHRRMIRTATARADCMIYSTAFARDSVSNALARMGRRNVPSLVRALPLSPAFAEAAPPPAALAGQHYFVVVSTIEPRKNHALLLRVWKRLIDRMGANAPHLVIVGSRGFQAQSILHPIGRDAGLTSRVHEVSGLATRDLVMLLRGAAGLLSPTWAEGFGLPVFEANHLGVPTIASDIAAHREIADATTRLLPCDDEAAWEAAIAALEPAGPRPAPAMSLRHGEASFAEDVLAFLGDMALASRAVRHPALAATRADFRLSRA